MPKKNKDKTFSVIQPILSFRQPAATGQAGGGVVIAVKILITFIIVVGLSVINPAIVSPKIVSKNSTVVKITEPQPVLAEENLRTPNPVLLNIPSIKVVAPFEAIGLNADRTIEVPVKDMTVGWFTYGAKPGDAGVSVVVGHLDSVKGGAVFEDLHRIKVGDNVIIERQDGSKVVYTVDSLAKFSQNNFPTKLVYGVTNFPAIRLITCSGTYNKKTGSYSENLVVFGSIK